MGHWNREEFRNIVVFASMLGSSRGLKNGQTVQCNTSLLDVSTVSSSSHVAGRAVQGA
jgi:hypothetical protein